MKFKNTDILDGEGSTSNNKLPQVKKCNFNTCSLY
jgi:hypothetical protein